MVALRTVRTRVSPERLVPHVEKAYNYLKKLINRKKSELEKLPVDIAYDYLEKKATFGDYLFLSEQLAKSHEDTRNMSYIAVNDLGMEENLMQFSDSPQLMLLEMIYVTKREVEELVKTQDGDDDRTFDCLNARMQALMGMMGRYEIFNKNMGDEEWMRKNCPRTNTTYLKVNYRKAGKDYIKPVRMKKTGVFRKRFEEYSSAYESLVGKHASNDGIKDGAMKFAFSPPTSAEEFDNSIDPTALYASLKALYEHDKLTYKRFINGFTKYADYLLNVAARKRVEEYGNLTLRDIVKDTILLTADMYREKAKELEHTQAQNRFIEEVCSTLSGKSYLVQSDIANFMSASS